MSAKALLLLAALALSGCLTGATPDTEPAADDAPIVVTRPDDFAALENASMDTPAGARWHVHDYWNGADRLVVMAGESWEGHWTCTGCSDGVMIRLRPPPKSVVPLGASFVEVTLDWVEEVGDHGPPALWVKRAAEDAPSKIADITSGAPIVVETSNEQNDPPHQVLSLWEFWLVLPPNGDRAEFGGTVSGRVEAVRGLEIPAFPPHPDLWNGATEITLLSEAMGPFTQTEVDQGDGRMQDCELGCMIIHSPADGAIVPYDASEVVVTVRHGPGFPAFSGLLAHGADTWDLAGVTGESHEPGVFVYRVPVTPENGDSPYAKQSLWELQLFVDEPTPARFWMGSYEIEARAVKA